MYSAHQKDRQKDYLEEMREFMNIMGQYVLQLGTPTSITGGITEDGAVIQINYSKVGDTPVPHLAGKYGSKGSQPIRYLGLPPPNAGKGYNAGSYLNSKGGAYRGAKASGGKAGSAGSAGSSSSAGSSGSSGGGK